MQRKTWIKLLMIIGLVGMLFQFSYATGFKIRADIAQGFNFQIDEKTPIGHITALTIAGKKFNNNLVVQNPTKLENKLGEKVVGIITAMRWNGGQTEPIIFTCQVTAKNREIAAILTHKKLNNTEVEFAFNVYEFDKNAYYRSFYTSEQGIQGEIEKTNGELEMEIDDEPSSEVPSPRNYELYLSIMPSEANAYLLNLATSKNNIVQKPWGIKAK